MAWAIKFRPKGKSRYSFMTPTGGGNHLKVHASRWEDKEEAQVRLDRLKAHYPNQEFRLQEV